MRIADASAIYRLPETVLTWIYIKTGKEKSIFRTEFLSHCDKPTDATFVYQGGMGVLGLCSLDSSKQLPSLPQSIMSEQDISPCLAGSYEYLGHLDDFNTIGAIARGASAFALTVFLDAAILKKSFSYQKS